MELTLSQFTCKKETVKLELAYVFQNFEHAPHSFILDMSVLQFYDFKHYITGYLYKFEECFSCVERMEKELRTYLGYLYHGWATITYIFLKAKLISFLVQGKSYQEMKYIKTNICNAQEKLVDNRSSCSQWK